MAQTWAKYVPDTETPLVAIPLAWHLLIQENIPVYKTLVTTASGGVAVSLPAAFTAQISAATAYAVQMTKQTTDPDGGELYVSDKTTSGFRVRNTGSAYGETVLICVYWLRP